MRAKPPSSMLGGSPMRVAAPCRLLEIAMATMIRTGFTASFLASASAIGATIITVATFSTKAERTEVSRQMNNIAQVVFGDLSTMVSARYAGTRLSMKTSATAIVPTKMPMTFQLMDISTSAGAAVRVAINTPAARRAPATQTPVRWCGKTTNRTYAATNIARHTQPTSITSLS